MRKLILNGYIEDNSPFDEDITPKRLHDLLHGEDGSLEDDVEILLNSYGGSCNAAVRMFDMLKAYPGHTSITISGTAASAATVFIQGADEVAITPGSLFMIHDPLTIAIGNKADMKKAIEMLDICKESIINQYKARSPLERDEISKLMSRETWMDANEALANGFVDRIVGDGVQNAVTDRAEAVGMVNAWRKRHGLLADVKAEETEEETEEEESEEETEEEKPEQEPGNKEPDTEEESEEETEEEETEEEPDDLAADLAAADLATRNEIMAWLAGELAALN